MENNIFQSARENLSDLKLYIFVGFNEDSLKRIQLVGSQGRAMTKMSLVTKMQEVRKKNAVGIWINMIKVFTNHKPKNKIILVIIKY